MKTRYQYQLILDQATSLYQAEIEISQVLDALQAKAKEPGLKERIAQEAEENKRHCERLEGVVAVLSKTPDKLLENEILWKDFCNKVAAIIKRVAFKHADVGYKTAIIVALALGQNEVANMLKCSLSSGNLIFIK